MRTFCSRSVEKYGLNYDTVTLREVSREAFDYEYALNAKVQKVKNHAGAGS